MRCHHELPVLGRCGLQLGRRRDGAQLSPAMLCRMGRASGSLPQPLLHVFPSATTHWQLPAARMQSDTIGNSRPECGTAEADRLGMTTCGIVVAPPSKAQCFCTTQCINGVCPVGGKCPPVCSILRQLAKLCILRAVTLAMPLCKAHSLLVLLRAPQFGPSLPPPGCRSASALLTARTLTTGATLWRGLLSARSAAPPPATSAWRAWPTAAAAARATLTPATPAASTQTATSVMSPLTPPTPSASRAARPPARASSRAAPIACAPAPPPLASPASASHSAPTAARTPLRPTSTAAAAPAAAPAAQTACAAASTTTVRAACATPLRGGVW